VYQHEIEVDRKKEYALYHPWDLGKRGYHPYWFIVLRETNQEPFFDRSMLEHEIAHVLERKLRESALMKGAQLIKIGTLARTITGTAEPKVRR
jgi:hypothetical protein